MSSSEPSAASRSQPASVTEYTAVSPCIKICQLDLADRCLGCGRTRSEIGGWSGMSLDERRAVNARLRFRGHGENR